MWFLILGALLALLGVWLVYTGTWADPPFWSGVWFVGTFVLAVVLWISGTAGLLMSLGSSAVVVALTLEALLIGGQYMHDTGRIK